MNPLYDQMQGQNGGLMAKFQQFQKTFRGDPQQQIQQLLNSGKVSQADYNRAYQQATQFARMLGIK